MDEQWQGLASQSLRLATPLICKGPSPVHARPASHSRLLVFSPQVCDSHLFGIFVGFSFMKQALAQAAPKLTCQP